MDSPPNQSLPPVVTPNPPHSGSGQKWKKAFVPLGVMGVLLLKFKGLLIPALKFLPVLLKTGGTMFLTIWLYAQAWGWWYALGFVLLIFVHECGHLLAAKRIGLKVGAPVFIPFMGAFIALKEAPKNAWIEASVGIGGPILGSLGALLCNSLGEIFDAPVFIALAFMGYFLNLFNLTPVGMLDGGRIVTALSRWLWLPGMAVLIWFGWQYPNFIVWLMIILSLPRVVSLFRKHTEEERRYYEVTPVQRWTMSIMCFGLIIILILGMRLAEHDLKEQGLHPGHERDPIVQ
jgi:Zn-dependent protease